MLSSDVYSVVLDAAVNASSASPRVCKYLDANDSGEDIILWDKKVIPSNLGVIYLTSLEGGEGEIFYHSPDIYTLYKTVMRSQQYGHRVRVHHFGYLSLSMYDSSVIAIDTLARNTPYHRMDGKLMKRWSKEDLYDARLLSCFIEHVCLIDKNRPADALTGLVC